MSNWSYFTPDLHCYNCPHRDLLLWTCIDGEYKYVCFRCNQNRTRENWLARQAAAEKEA